MKKENKMMKINNISRNYHASFILLSQYEDKMKSRKGVVENGNRFGRSIKKN